MTAAERAASYEAAALAAREEAILKAAQQHLGLETLETRGREALDVRDLSVGSIKAALEAAYEAGRAAAPSP